MLIHVTPSFYTPTILSHLYLVDFSIEEIDLVLREGKDIAVRRPYPNKRYWVGCRKIGQKAHDGLLIVANRFLPSFTATTRWTVCENSEFHLVTHRVHYVLADNAFDTVTDKSLLWSRFTCESGREFGDRWPNCYSDKAPVDVRLRMQLFSDPLRKTEAHEEVSESGSVLLRSEKLLVPTIERERLWQKGEIWDRIPPMEHAFRC